MREFVDIAAHDESHDIYTADRMGQYSRVDDGGMGRSVRTRCGDDAEAGLGGGQGTDSIEILDTQTLLC